MAGQNLEPAGARNAARGGERGIRVALAHGISLVCIVSSSSTRNVVACSREYALFGHTPKCYLLFSLCSRYSCSNTCNYLEWSRRQSQIQAAAGPPMPNTACLQGPPELLALAFAPALPACRKLVETWQGVPSILHLVVKTQQGVQAMYHESCHLTCLMLPVFGGSDDVLAHACIPQKLITKFMADSTGGCRPPTRGGILSLFVYISPLE